MPEVIFALLRTLNTLMQGRVWRAVLAPAVFSLVLWLGLAWLGLASLVGWLMDMPPMTLLVAWGAIWVAQLLAYMGAWMLVFALAYLTSSVLAAIFIMPSLIKLLAATDYPDVAAMGADSFVGAVGNSLRATVLFVVGWLLMVPLWLIPGMSLILPVLLMGWYNRRTFAYDALSLHATEAEWRRLYQENKRGLFMLGLVMALLAHVPVLGLFVPTLAALAFVHFGLDVLRRSRGGAVVTIEGEVV